ncbi:M28 family peptidase [Klebsiella pneumoniae subsp. pneumoniae]|nr:M28 family peptidase [Klebsiella pneumoniae subsp. pneumoniae]
MGLGVLLELAEHLKNVPTRYGIRFIATSGEEEGRLGAQNLLQRMSEAERENTLLVINLDNLVVGDKLYFNSGRSTPASVRKLTRDRALAIARSKGIAAYTNRDSTRLIRKAPAAAMTPAPSTTPGSRCCRSRRLTGHRQKDGYQQRSKSASFPQGTSWHDVQLDNQQYIDHALPGRINEHRGREVVKVMLPLVKELAKVEKPSSLK